MFKTRHVPAAELLVDDRFKMGGSMYRIQMTAKTKFVTIMEVYNIEDPHIRLHLEVPRETRFKIYNQK